MMIFVGMAPSYDRLDPRLRLLGASMEQTPPRPPPCGPGISVATTLTSPGIRSKLNRMRTTLDLPEPLIEEARRLLGFKSKTDTVVVSLQELVRKKRVEELKSMLGRVKLEIDLPKSRRRPRKRS